MKVIAGSLVVLGLLIGLYGARKLAKAEAGVEITDPDQRIPVRSGVELTSSEALTFAGAGAVLAAGGGLLLALASKSKKKKKS